ncbi:YneF family protein [Aneurinibacillus uraniidurans]|uniref:YneF family protein n=1 Tax=Aneurinibacillus uraniidurans TaxID=2966586 RepID=UPI0023494EB5|nr:YneF family protein [Aneurinibacillus sp. B1]WCN37371.1 YneF family protein [Aneurinibacillus sp. B1]
MWQYITPVLTLILGLAGGFALGVWYLKNQMTNMQMDEKQIQQIARSMGMNLNQKQMNQLSRKMQTQPKSGAGKKKK